MLRLSFEYQPTKPTSRYSPAPCAAGRCGRCQLAEHLPEAAATACVEFLFGPLADNPTRVGASLRPPFAGQRRTRRGEYRVRYRIDDAKRVTYVLDIDHRRDAYRRRSETSVRSGP
ncbi:MAG: type II toxin-antitoxin system RelE/ParE family toxin [Dermatophilaceae bacterium]